MPHRTVLLVISSVFVFSAGAQSVSPDVRTADPLRFVRWTVGDAAGMARSAVLQAPLVAGVAASLLASSGIVDPGLNDNVRLWASGSVGTFLERTNGLGGPPMTGKVAALFAATLLTGNERLQDAAFTSLESLLYAGAVSYGVKFAVGRQRPADTPDPLNFRPLSGHSSFPSGHTTTAFAVVVPWVLYYPSPVGKALMVLPVGTALARMQRDKHWGTDVLAGAVLGTLTARSLYRRHTGQSRPSVWRPQIRASASQASFEWRF